MRRSAHTNHMFLYRCVRTHTYIHTEIHKHTLFDTHSTRICTPASAHTHIPYTRCVCISEYTHPRMHIFAPSHTHTSTDPLSPILPPLIPYQPPALPPGAPPAALPPPPALLRTLLPNAEAANPPTPEQTAGSISTLHTQPASNATKRPCTHAYCPSANQRCVPSCWPRVQYVFVCLWLVRERLFMCV